MSLDITNFKEDTVRGLLHDDLYENILKDGNEILALTYEGFTIGGKSLLNGLMNIMRDFTLPVTSSIDNILTVPNLVNVTKYEEGSIIHILIKDDIIGTASLKVGDLPTIPLNFNNVKLISGNDYGFIYRSGEFHILKYPQLSLINILEDLIGLQTNLALYMSQLDYFKSNRGISTELQTALDLFKTNVDKLKVDANTLAESEDFTKVIVVYNQLVEDATNLISQIGLENDLFNKIKNSVNYARRVDIDVGRNTLLTDLDNVTINYATLVQSVIDIRARQTSILNGYFDKLNTFKITQDYVRNKNIAMRITVDDVATYVTNLTTLYNDLISSNLTEYNIFTNWISDILPDLFTRTETLVNSISTIALPLLITTEYDNMISEKTTLDSTLTDLEIIRLGVNRKISLYGELLTPEQQARLDAINVKVIAITEAVQASMDKLESTNHGVVDDSNFVNLYNAMKILNDNIYTINLRDKERKSIQDIDYTAVLNYSTVNSRYNSYWRDLIADMISQFNIDLGIIDTFILEETYLRNDTLTTPTYPDLYTTIIDKVESLEGLISYSDQTILDDAIDSFKMSYETFQTLLSVVPNVYLNGFTEAGGTVDNSVVTAFRWYVNNNGIFSSGPVSVFNETYIPFHDNIIYDISLDSMTSTVNPLTILEDSGIPLVGYYTIISDRHVFPLAEEIYNIQLGETVYILDGIDTIRQGVPYVFKFDGIETFTFIDVYNESPKFLTIDLTAYIGSSLRPDWLGGDIDLVCNVTNKRVKLNATLDVFTVEDILPTDILGRSMLQNISGRCRFEGTNFIYNDGEVTFSISNLTNLGLTIDKTFRDTIIKNVSYNRDNNVLFFTLGGNDVYVISGTGYVEKISFTGIVRLFNELDVTIAYVEGVGIWLPEVNPNKVLFRNGIKDYAMDIDDNLKLGIPYLHANGGGASRLLRGVDDFFINTSVIGKYGKRLVKPLIDKLKTITI